MPRTSFFNSCLGVFQGGGCRAAALVGAYEEAVDRGVNFTEVAGTSAGSIVAALIGAGISSAQLKKFVEELDFRSLLKPPEKSGASLAKRIVIFPAGKMGDVLLHQGMHSSEAIGTWVETCLKEILGEKQGPITFADLVVPTTIVAANLHTRKVHVWNSKLTPNESVAHAVRSSCSIPFFFQPVDQQFVDGGTLSNLPAFVFANNAADRPLTSRVLAFALKSDFEPVPEWSTTTFLSALTDTIVEGSQEIQLRLHTDVHVIEIPTGKIKATDFEKINASQVQDLIAAGKSAAGKFFDNELIEVRAHRAAPDACYDRAELYGEITRHINPAPNEVIIAEHDTEFVYSIFPTLLLWSLSGTRIKILLPPREEKVDHGKYRRNLLRKLGAYVVETENAIQRSYFFDATDPTSASVYIAMPETTGARRFEAVIYTGAIHSYAIEAVYEKVSGYFSREFSGSRPELISQHPESVVSRVRNVTQYSRSGIGIQLQTIPIKNLSSLTNYVREFKYHQIRHLADAFTARGLKLFSPAVVRFWGGGESIVTPPVVEKSGDKYILVEGSTRATFLRDSGFTEIEALVVNGVSDALPSGITPFSRVRVVGREMPPAERYGNFDYRLFRHIERAVHPLDSL